MKRICKAAAERRHESIEEHPVLEASLRMEEKWSQLFHFSRHETVVLKQVNKFDGDFCGGTLVIVSKRYRGPLA